MIASAPAVIFDCDGVLVDTETCWTRAYTRLFAAHGHALTTADRHSLAGRDLATVDRILAACLDLPADGRLAQAALSLAQKEIGAGVRPMPGAVSIVSALKGRPVAVASNSPAATIREHLTRSGIPMAFDAIVGGDEAPTPKPTPHLYTLACERLEVDPGDTIAIEDSPTGAASAKTAGLYVIVICPTLDMCLNVDLQASALTDASVSSALGLPRTRL